MDEIKEVRFLTDDKDARRRNELVISLGGNGDWYVAVVPEGEGTVGRSVRICTSGGAATANPGLPTAIADAFRSITSPQDKPVLDPFRFVVIWKKDDSPTELFYFYNESEAMDFYDKASQSWTQVMLCKIIKGP